MMNDKVTNLCEIISIFHSEQFLELVIDDIRTTPNLLTSLVLTTLHNTETTHRHTGPHTFTQDHTPSYRTTQLHTGRDEWYIQLAYKTKTGFTGRIELQNCKF